MLDVMHKESKQLNEAQKSTIDKIKAMGNEFYCLLSEINNSTINRELSFNREFALAKTKLEEAVMWAVKGICNL